MSDPRCTALTATRVSHPDDEPEAEPVVVEATEDVVRLVLDDGETIDFDRRELIAAAQAA